MEEYYLGNIIGITLVYIIFCTIYFLDHFFSDKEKEIVSNICTMKKLSINALALHGLDLPNRVSRRFKKKN